MLDVNHVCYSRVQYATDQSLHTSPITNQTSVTTTNTPHDQKKPQTSQAPSTLTHTHPHPHPHPQPITKYIHPSPPSDKQSTLLNQNPTNKKPDLQRSRAPPIKRSLTSPSLPPVSGMNIDPGTTRLSPPQGVEYEEIKHIKIRLRAGQRHLRGHFL